LSHLTYSSLTVVFIQSKSVISDEQLIHYTHPNTKTLFK